MLKHIVLYVHTVVINTNNTCKCDFSQIFYKFDFFNETVLRLVDERCVTSFLGNLQRCIPIPHNITFSNYFIYTCFDNRHQLLGGGGNLVIFLS